MVVLSTFDGVMTYKNGDAVATVKPEGRRFRVVVKVNGKVTIDTSQCSLGAAQTMGEWATA